MRMKNNFYVINFNEEHNAFHHFLIVMNGYFLSKHVFICARIAAKILPKLQLMLDASNMQILFTLQRNWLNFLTDLTIEFNHQILNCHLVVVLNTLRCFQFIKDFSKTLLF